MSYKKNLLYEFPYEKNSKGLYTPKAIISIESIDKSQRQEFSGIVDTGSEITLISSEIIKQFNFPATGKEEVLKCASAGEEINIVSCYGRIGFQAPIPNKTSYCTVMIYSCKRESLQQDIILGMNFINKYEMNFSGKHKKLTIEEIKKNRVKQYLKIL